MNAVQESHPLSQMSVDLSKSSGTFALRSQSQELCNQALKMTSQPADFSIMYIKKLSAALAYALLGTPSLLLKSTSTQKPFVIERYCNVAMKKRLLHLQNDCFGILLFKRCDNFVPSLPQDAYKLQQVGQNFASSNYAIHSKNYKNISIPSKFAKTILLQPPQRTTDGLQNEL